MKNKNAKLLEEISSILTMLSYDISSSSMDLVDQAVNLAKKYRTKSHSNQS